MQMEHAERVKLEIDRAGRLGVTERAGSVPRGSALADALSLAQRCADPSLHVSLVCNAMCLGASTIFMQGTIKNHPRR